MPGIREVVVMLLVGVMGALVHGVPSAFASDHDWGSGTPYSECRSRGLTNYGPVTGKRWIRNGTFYANLYHCTAPTATTPREPDWGSGTPYSECRSRGLTNYGPVTGKRWIRNGTFYANLYHCAAPAVTPASGSVPAGVLRPDDYSSPRVVVEELSVHHRPPSPGVLQPRPDLPEWDYSLPMDWAADPFEDRNWQFLVHSWVMMEYWLYAYQDGDLGSLEHIAAIALDWERFHVQDNRESRFQWYDMAAGIRASRLAFLLDNIFVGNLDIEDDDLAALTRLAELHVRKLLDPRFLSLGNHGLFQLAGLNLLCAVLSWRSVCNSARSYVDTAFARLLDRWFTDESVHRENSPNYHGIVLDALQRLRIAERTRLPGVRTLIEDGARVTPWLTYPDGRWVPVGDSAGIGLPLTGPVEPHCLDGEAGCWAVRDLTKSGYAIIRSLPGAEESSMLFVNAMFVNVVGAVIRHKHTDDLGFVLIEGGREIFVDSGKYGYNKDHMRSYVLSARAHNIPSLVSRPIDPRKVDPAETHLQPIRTTDSGFVVEGFVDRPGLLRHERTFSYTPGSSLTIRDRLYNRTSSRWQSNLHLAPDLDPVINTSGFLVQVGDVLVRAVFEGDGCQIDMARGDTDPYQGWVSVGYLEMTPATVVRATCPPDLVDTSWRITFQR